MRKLLIVSAGLLLGVLVVSGAGSAGKTTLEVLSAETDPNSVAALKTVFSEFEAKHPDVAVQPQFVTWGDLAKRLVASMAAGAPVAITLQNDSQVQFLLAQNTLTPVDDLVDSVGRADFLPRALNAFTKDGKTYGVPSIVNYTLVWYRTDLYEKYGLKPAATWAELEKNAETIATRTKQEGTEVYGIGLPLATSGACQDELFHNLIWSNGATIFDKQGNITFNQPAVGQALDFIKALKASAPPDVATYTHLEPLTAYTAGKTAHVIYGGRLLTYLQRNNPELLDKTDAVLMPRGPAPGGHNASHNWVKGWVIPKQAPDRTALAKELVALMESRQNALRWLQAVPLHHLSPRRSIAESKEFGDVPLARTRAGKAVLRLAGDATGRYGVLATYQTGERNADIAKVLEANIPCKAVQQVAVAGAATGEALKQGEQDIKQLLKK